MTAASKLVGLALDGGYRVVEQLKSQPSSGGIFSVPYVVEDKSGKRHFLKAFDFSSAFEPGKDVVKELQRMTAAFEHERDILDHCKSRRLSAVVVAITHGYVQVPNTPRTEGTVYFLIFELADGDVRRQVDLGQRLDLLWCLRVLDDVTLGLWQVHREGIAHQDTKPSNVLIYEGKGCRIGDFGRSSRRGRQTWMDELTIAGDQSYAPPELLYSFCHADFIVRRVGCDLFLLGNLASFMFSGVNITAAIFGRLDPQFHPQRWGGTYEEVLPHLQRAFDEALESLRPEIDELVRDEITSVVRELCHPDIGRRGHPKGIGQFNQYSLERYKARFDLLLKRTSISVRVQRQLA